MVGRPALEGIGEGFVVGHNEKIMTFHRVAKMLNGQINGKQLTIKRAVVLLCRVEFA